MKDLIWIEVSKSAIINNFRRLRRIVGEGVVLSVAVKANAYGHGIKEISKLLAENGADWLAVNSIEEAETLRNHGIKKPILIMGFVQKKDLPKVADLDTRIFLYDISTAKELSKIAVKRGKKVFVHIKADTGLSRLGVLPDGVLSFANELKKMKGIRIEGVATHFATNDDGDDEGHFKAQLASFRNIANVLSESGIKNLMINGSNSASSIICGELGFGIVRAGIAIYGYHSSEYVKNYCQKKSIEFLPALSLKTKVAQVKEIGKGSCVSYSCDFISKKKTKIAILPVGYYDGLDRKLGNIGYVLIKGKKAKIIGRVCMNMTVVDASGIDDVSPEDEVVLIGKQGGQEITTDDIAKQTNTINYEVLARLRESIVRYYT